MGASINNINFNSLFNLFVLFLEFRSMIFANIVTLQSYTSFARDQHSPSVNVIFLKALKRHFFIQLLAMSDGVLHTII